jgi:DNA-binding NtrC family response regulator
MDCKPRKFLIIDDNPDGRYLLVRSLHRKYPAALIQECGDATTALTTISQELHHAVIVHRAGEVDGVTLVQLIRRMDRTVPVILVSGIDRSVEAREAGATLFLNYDAWLNIGNTVTEALATGAQSATSEPTPA